MMYAFIVERCADLPVEQCCRVMKVSRSAIYGWSHRQANPTVKMLADAELGELIVKVHDQSRGTYGSPRVTAELRLGLGWQVNRKRVARLMRERGLQGISRRRHPIGCTRRRISDPVGADLVHRQFRPDSPDRLWVPSRSSLRCNANCSTGAIGRHEPNWPAPCSSGSKPSTTRPAATPPSTTSAPSTMKPPNGMIHTPTPSAIRGKLQPGPGNTRLVEIGERVVVRLLRHRHPRCTDGRTRLRHPPPHCSRVRRMSFIRSTRWRLSVGLTSNSWTR